MSGADLFDGFFAVLFLYLGVKGFLRGLTGEICSLLGLFGGIFLAWKLGPILGEHFSGSIPPDKLSVATIIIMAIIFIARKSWLFPYLQNDTSGGEICLFGNPGSFGGDSLGAGEGDGAVAPCFRDGHHDPASPYPKLVCGKPLHACGRYDMASHFGIHGFSRHDLSWKCPKFLPGGALLYHSLPPKPSKGKSLLG